MHPFILIEGLDRTGKSTIARRVAEAMGGRQLHSPPDVLVPFRAGFDSLSDDEINFCFYLVGNHVLNQQIAKILKRSPVVLDRHFPSTVAYHSPKLGRNLDYCLEGMSPLPNRIYYLTGDLDVLDERARVTCTRNDRFHGFDYWRQVASHYDRIFKGNETVVRVDTTDMAEDVVYKFVFGDLKESGLFVEG